MGTTMGTTICLSAWVFSADDRKWVRTFCHVQSGQYFLSTMFSGQGSTMPLLKCMPFFPTRSSLATGPSDEGLPSRGWRCQCLVMCVFSVERKLPLVLEALATNSYELLEHASPMSRRKAMLPALTSATKVGVWISMCLNIDILLLLQEIAPCFSKKKVRECFNPPPCWKLCAYLNFPFFSFPKPIMPVTQACLSM